MATWIKVLAGLAPLLIGALVGIAWTNSHTMAVSMIRIDAMEKHLDHLRELVEQRLCPPVGVPR